MPDLNDVPNVPVAPIISSVEFLAEQEMKAHIEKNQLTIGRFSFSFMLPQKSQTGDLR